MLNFSLTQQNEEKDEVDIYVTYFWDVFIYRCGEEKVGRYVVKTALIYFLVLYIYLLVPIM